MRHDDDVYREVERTFYYIFFASQFNIAQLTVTKRYNHKGAVLFQENYLDLSQMGEIKLQYLEQYIKADWIGTNLERTSLLFKGLKKQLPKLKNFYDNQLFLAYQNLIGGLYDKQTVVATQCLELIEKLKKEIDFTEGKYPPPIVALAQLSKQINRYCNNIDYLQAINSIQKIQQRS